MEIVISSARFRLSSRFPGVGLIRDLQKIGFDKLFINNEYKDAVEQVRVKARELRADVSNPAFRLLQILERVGD